MRWLFRRREARRARHGVDHVEMHKRSCPKGYWAYHGPTTLDCAVSQISDFSVMAGDLSVPAPLWDGPR